MYITINSFNRFAGIDGIRPGTRLILKKDINNLRDDEAIKVYSLNHAPYGYVANSVQTVARGTHSAGYIYDTFKEECECIVRFVYDEIAIAEIV